ncbi:MAG: OmpA family protein, partial [Chloroflexia bacterium]|nr:OmpA family protein [Chloroflexia bacterium]
VKEYLVAKSIPEIRIIAKGYGETKPVTENTTEENRQLNRRVEFTILKN